MNFVQLVWISAAVSCLILIFGIRYLKSKENMALIERNRDIKRGTDLKSLFSSGAALVGISIGLLAGIIATSFVDSDNIPIPIIYLLSISFFCGISLIVSYFFLKRDN